MEIRAINGSVRFSAAVGTHRELVEKAVEEKVDLSCVSLRGWDLRGAKMAEVKMPGADLAGTDFSGADLTNADMRWTNLRGQKFGEDTKLFDTIMTNADVTGADGLRMGYAWITAKRMGAIRDESNPSGAYSHSINLPGSNLPAAFMDKADLIAAANQESAVRIKGFWTFLNSAEGTQIKINLKDINISSGDLEQREGRSMRR